MQITPTTRKIAEEFVLELWWADDVAPKRLEELLFNLIISVIDSYSGWRDLISLLRTKPPVSLDPRIRQAIARAYAQLRDDIVEGSLAPGEKLRVEHLKTRYQVGAGTLREAITRLVSDARVAAEGQRGFRVAPMALEDLEDLTRLRPIGLADSGRDVHAEHREIFEPAMAGMEARAALALEAHIRATPDLLLRATREGQKVLPA